jgi:hypothetical protein
VATVRYQVDGAPPQWADAWMPMPTLTPAGATSVSRFTFGAPGTEEVPLSPNHKASASLSRSSEWHDPSSVAPDYFRPNIYVNDVSQLKPPVRYLPAPVAMLVPPVVPVGTHGPLGPSAVVMRGRKIGGRRSMHWLRAVPTWPNLRGGAAGS